MEILLIFSKILGFEFSEGEFVRFKKNNKKLPVFQIPNEEGDI